MTAISTELASATAIAAAYLVGAIPFAYVVAKAVAGIDIRTVGSGNVGATNVGRVLGRRYFGIVLALDLLKGLIPTVAFPWLVGRATGRVPVDLPVLIALAAILGHTFPVYLGFRGGKGVATSLGVVIALDPVSCVAAVLIFGVVLWTWRYVSLASLVGGAGFAVVHIVRVGTPFNREHIAMTLFSIAVVVLLVVRHRSNLARIRAGTEHRVNLRRERDRREPPAGDVPDSPAGDSRPSPGGRIGLFLAIGLAVASLAMGAGLWLVRNAGRTIEAEIGPWALREADRLNTGQQRIDRVAFTAGGDRLAGICPRYNRLVIFEVDSKDRLRPVAEAQLEGRPVSIASLGTRFAVLQRPAGDSKHLEPGWWEVFDRDGKRAGSRQLSGFYPDDLAASADGRRLFVLCSGRSEGDASKPPAALDIYDFDPDVPAWHPLGRIELDTTDDPERLTLSATARFAAVFLAKSKRTAAIDLSDPSAPKLMGRTDRVDADAPYISSSGDSDWIMMPAASEGETLALAAPSPGRGDRPAGDRPTASAADYLITSRPNDSALQILRASPLHEVGRFPLFGPFNLGRTRPTGLAYSPGRGLIAVATRTGSIHLIELRPRWDVPESRGSAVARGRESVPRR